MVMRMFNRQELKDFQSYTSLGRIIAKIITRDEKKDFPKMAFVSHEEEEVIKSNSHALGDRDNYSGFAPIPVGPDAYSTEEQYYWTLRRGCLRVDIY